MIKSVDLQNNPYLIYIDEDKELSFNTKVAIITNKTIAKLHLQRLKTMIKAKELLIIELKDGERYKKLFSVEYIIKELLKANFDRSDTIIGFGGGVITDIAGFVASIYLRGISFINIPTSLLACVDASVGGKTGVNSDFGKNLIGSFYQPKAVFIYTDFLKTLAKKELAKGRAEALKMALCFDELFAYEFFNKLSLKELISKSLAIKIAVVVRDEKEENERMLLNFAHTFAHVIEKQSKNKISHGKAVAIGIKMATELSLEHKLLKKAQEQKIKKLLKKQELDFSYEIADISSFYEDFYLDKKTKNKQIRFILLEKIGKGALYTVDKKTVLKVLKKYEKKSENIY